mmetsp:Transcript_12959/g.23831  ORF Transcript_12959/g.23831 Transcript_12959/m.23831 type:complete len:119 (-) Transcript_12959:851-1207(-)
MLYFICILTFRNDGSSLFKSIDRVSLTEIILLLRGKIAPPSPSSRQRMPENQQQRLLRQHVPHLSPKPFGYTNSWHQHHLLALSTHFYTGVDQLSTKKLSIARNRCSSATLCKAATSV